VVYDHWLGGPLSRLTVGGVFFAFLKVGLSVGVAMIRVYIYRPIWSQARCPRQVSSR